jgi:phenylacetate-CoA ligase
VSFYRKRFDETDLRPDAIKTVEDVARIPFTVKTDLRDNYPLGILAVPQNRL